MDVDYILYGKTEENKSNLAKTLSNVINRNDKDELRVYYKCICTIKSYINKKQQNLLKQANIVSEDRDYSPEEIKKCINSISEHIMSQSSKNGDLSNEMTKFNELANLLIRNEKDI